MCGIFGYISKKHLDLSDKMMIERSFAHRGPDDRGEFQEGDVWFCHRRLSILDVSHLGHQPMVSEDGNYVLIYNGEIYNHTEIRKRLRSKGYNFVSESDTETLLYGYAEYKAEILHQLNGIFAFAVYDRKEDTVFVARDHFGVKPLYYYHTNGVTAFASEMKSLAVIPNAKLTLNTQALVYYLEMLYAPGEITSFNEIKKLLPGHYLKIRLSGGELVTKRYHQIQFPVHTGFRESEWTNEVDIALQRAVGRQLQSDVPVGVFLSGGLDSSLIASIATKLSGADTLTAFTIRSNQAFYNEGFEEDEYYARQLAKHLGIRLETVDADISIVDDFDHMILHLDEPQADPAPLLVYKISQKAKEADIKVLLSGAGADDIFSGYRRHQALNYERLFNSVPGGVYDRLNETTKNVREFSPTMRRVKKMISAGSQSKYERWANYFAWLPEEQTLRLFNKDVLATLNPADLPMQYWKNIFRKLSPGTASLNKMLYAEMTTFLPDHNLNYVDKMAMAEGVEARVPFLDTELVSIANSMPVKYKMRGDKTKYILRELGKRHVPDSILNRKKTGFGAPVRQWIRNEMSEMVHQRLKSSMLNEVFDRKEIALLIENNASGKIDASYSIWSLLAIESWMRQFVTAKKTSTVI